MKQRNYFRINKGAFIFYHFAIVDIGDYLSKPIFVQHRIPVRFGQEFKSQINGYRLVFVKCRKKYGKEFLLAMRDLANVMKKLGHQDYPECCKDVERLFKGE